MTNPRAVTPGVRSRFPRRRGPCIVNSCRRIALVLLVCFSWFGDSRAEEAAGSGVVIGRVSNAGTDAYLEGAVVTLEPGGRSTLTTGTGEFVFTRVPDGTYSLTAYFTGLDPRTVPVSVGSGGRVVQELQLTTGIYQLDKFIVAGEREGNAAAITQQRNADNIKSVMASNAFGNVADLNIGTFIMRMPGVTKTETEGDVTGIMIRGISDNLSMLTIDGELGASASPQGGMKRAFEVDKIPADFIESIEVVKSLTPDLDAGAVGGIVNMKTKSALTEGPASHLPGWRGVQRMARHDAPFRERHLLGRAWRAAAAGRAGDVELQPDEQAARQQQFCLRGVDRHEPADLVQRDPWGEDYIENRRSGASARFDYRLTPNTTVYASVMHSDYIITLDRHRGHRG